MKKTLTILIIFSSLLIAQTNWQSINSPYGGNVNEVYRVNDSVYLAGLQNGSLYRSNDAGNTWTKVFNGVNTSWDRGVECFEKNHYGEIFVSSEGANLLRSTDDGLTWIETNCLANDFVINTTSGIMVAMDKNTTNSNLARSLDSGKTWTNFPVNIPLRNLKSFGDTLFKGFTDQLDYSTDFGDNWQVYGSNIYYHYSCYVTAIHIFSENEIMFAVRPSSSQWSSEAGIYYSSDSGNTWSQRNNGLSQYIINNIKQVNDTLFVCLENKGLQFTTDKGLHWSQYNGNSFQTKIYSIEEGADFNLVATPRGIYKVNRQMWFATSNGIHNYYPIKLFETESGKIFYYNSSQFFTSSNAGESWDLVDLKKFFGDNAITFKDSLMVVQNNNGALYSSTNEGDSWIQTGAYSFFNKDFDISEDNNTIYGSLYYFSGVGYIPPEAGFRRSTDFGVSWFMNMSYPHDTFEEIFTAPGNLVFVVLDIEGSSVNDGFYRSPNQGTSFIITNNNLPSISFKCFALDCNHIVFTAINEGIFKLNSDYSGWSFVAYNNFSNITQIEFNEHNHFVVINNGKIYSSVDGTDWYLASAGLENVNISLIYMDNEGYFYAADAGGYLYKTILPHIVNQLPSVPVLVSPINNQNVSADTVEVIWQKSSPMVMNYEINLSTDSLFGSFQTVTTKTISYKFHNLLANTNYYWRVKAMNEVGWSEYSTTGSFYTGLTGSEDEVPIVYTYKLEQNYPNPFNPVTKIRYELEQDGLVELTVYDILGNKIRELFKGEQEKGRHSIDFSGSELSSGVYIYKIKSGSFVETHKMVLLK